jgi:hypothetical protein
MLEWWGGDCPVSILTLLLSSKPSSLSNLRELVQILSLIKTVMTVTYITLSVSWGPPERSIPQTLKVSALSTSLNWLEKGGWIWHFFENTRGSRNIMHYYGWLLSQPQLW